MKTQTTFSIETPQPEKLKGKMKKLLEINKYQFQETAE